MFGGVFLKYWENLHMLIPCRRFQGCSIFPHSSTGGLTGILRLTISCYLDSKTFLLQCCYLGEPGLGISVLCACPELLCLTSSVVLVWVNEVKCLPKHYWYTCISKVFWLDSENHIKLFAGRISGSVFVRLSKDPSRDELWPAPDLIACGFG